MKINSKVLKSSLKDTVPYMEGHLASLNAILELAAKTYFLRVMKESKPFTYSKDDGGFVLWSQDCEILGSASVKEVFHLYLDGDDREPQDYTDVITELEDLIRLLKNKRRVAERTNPGLTPTPQDGDV